MGHLPFFQFYPADWIQDTQILSLEAQGAWIKILCTMWVAPRRGSVTFKKRHLNVFLADSSDERTHQIVVDLDTVANIEWRDSDGNIADSWECTAEITLNSRRMIREEVKRKEGLEADRRYREGRTSNKRREDVAKTSKIYQKSEVRSQNSEEDKNKSSQRPVVEASVSPDTISVQDFVDSWNATFTGKLPVVKLPLTESRKRRATARLREHSDLVFWETVFTNIDNSKFLLGHNSNGSHALWRCTFDFLITNDTNCVKIHEGSYNAKN